MGIQPRTLSARALRSMKPSSAPTSSSRSKARADRSIGSSRQPPNSRSPPIYRCSPNIRGEAPPGPQWTVEMGAWSPPPRLSDDELTAAKRVFYSMDQDGSGNIDKNELQCTMPSLGLSPSEEELQQLMDEADRASGGDANGKIELREFLGWYANTLRFKRDAPSDEARHAFHAVAGGQSGIMREELLRERLVQDFGLDVDVGAMFDLAAGQELALADFEKIVLG